ncbi:hypothetical protein LCGC14_2846670, partial [marine sediment metagenome]
MQLYKKVLVLKVLLTLCLISNAQSRTELEGRVYSIEAEVMGTHVVNRSSQRATITDGNGFFTIPVEMGDTLIFTAVQFRRKELILTQEILDLKTVTILLEETLTELKEVVVTPYNLSGNIDKDLSKIKIGPLVDASSLGLLDKNTRRMANGFLQTLRLSKYADLVIGYDTLTLEPKIYLVPKIIKIYDDISGNTKKFETYAAIENEITFVEHLRLQYTDAAFTQDLKIPEQNIIDFINYCSFATGFEKIVSTDDQLKLWEFMRDKS